MSLLEIKNLRFGYQDQRILDNLNFEIEKGSFLAIAGPNGAGKSTLVRILSNQLKPTKGVVLFEEKNIRNFAKKQLARKIAVVSQEFVPAFDFSVYETVMMARTVFFNKLGFETPNDRKIVQKALEATETTHLAQRKLDQISGGERQRVFIARALAQDTPVLILDEPTSSLDLKHQLRIFQLLKNMQLNHDITIITVSHNINLAAQYCDNVLLLGDKTKYHLDKPENLFKDNLLSHYFGVKGITGTLEGKHIFIPTGEDKIINDKYDSTKHD